MFSEQGTYVSLQNLKADPKGAIYEYWLSVVKIEFTENVIAKKLIMKPFVRMYLKKQQAKYIQDLREALGAKRL